MQTPVTRVLLVEDNPGDAELLALMLAQAPGGPPFVSDHVDRLAAGLARLRRGDIDVVLLDLSLPDSQGLATFHRMKAEAPAVPIVVMSGLNDETLAVQAVHEGAQDYLVKGEVDGRLLARPLRYAIERKQTEIALEQTAAELSRSNARLHALATSEREARLELQRAHEELKRTQAQLIQSARLASLGQLVAGVAHEINNPLALVSNNLAILQRDTQALAGLLRLYQEASAMLTAHQPELQRRIEEQAAVIDLSYTLENLQEVLARSANGARRIHQIVQDLRHFARWDSAGEPVPIDLNAGVTATCRILQGRAERQQVDLVVELAPLPQVLGHPLTINQVVLNLTTNALDACPAGGRVTVRTAATSDGVELHVTDTGPGITPAIRDRIFDPFFTTKPPGQGSGLGLTISHGIVRDHGGRIDVESAPGNGAHFIVYLPVPKK